MLDDGCVPNEVSTTSVWCCKSSILLSLSHCLFLPLLCSEP
jgi:hypothetical protein